MSTSFVTEQKACYTDEWKRTKPDFALYLPEAPAGNDGYNDHLHVISTRQGSLMAMWTQGSQEGSFDLRTVYAHSENGGASWSRPQRIPGASEIRGLVSCFGFPIVSQSGRIYCFFNQNLGFADGGHYFTSEMRCALSDDDGHTWHLDSFVIPVRRRKQYDHPDLKVPVKWIVWQKPIRDANNKLLVGFTRWSSVERFPKPKDAFHWDSSSELMRFENIDEDPDIKDLRITWLPEGEEPIRVPCPIEPEASKGYCLGEEPGVALLPDSRLFVTMRTVTGKIWYTVSQDNGRNWRKPEALRQHDNGPEMLHPKSPCPIYNLRNGRFLLFFHNHNGFGHGAQGPWDMNARRPLFVCVGEFRKDAYQPICFNDPLQFCDTQSIGVGPEGRIWLAMYASLWESHNDRIFWYPDRKHFLLGRRLTDVLLGIN